MPTPGQVQQSSFSTDVPPAVLAEDTESLWNGKPHWMPIFSILQQRPWAIPSRGLWAQGQPQGVPRCCNSCSGTALARPRCCNGVRAALWGGASQTHGILL